MASKNKVTEMDESRLIRNGAPQIELPSPSDLDTYNLENKLINRTSQRSCDLEILLSDKTSTLPPPYQLAQATIEEDAPVAGAENAFTYSFSCVPTITCSPSTLTIYNKCHTLAKMIIGGAVLVSVAYFVSRCFYNDIKLPSMYIVTNILVISRLTI